MSWADAKFDAEARFLHVCKQNAALLEQHGPPGVVSLVDYEDETTYRFLRAQDKWSYVYQRMVLRAYARLVKKAWGSKVRFMTLRLPDYFDWLLKKDLTDSPAHRAQFVAEKVL